MSRPLITLLGVKKTYESAGGTVLALVNVNLVIREGEFVAIVGTSGSGKSTLMNILGCLDRPTEGTYSLCGLDVGGRTSDERALVRNRLIGFIFQGFNLLPRTTALENVELPLSYRGISRKERRARAEKALRAVGLEKRMDHTPNQLSGGQQQRVAIARALVTEPPLLLADEPTGNLDTRTSLEVLSLLQRLNQRLGVTVCIVTHEPDIAACASRVITVRDGRVVSDARNPAPKRADLELAALPPLEQQKLTFEVDKDAVASARVPRRVGAYLVLGAIVGSAAGAAYGRFAWGGNEVVWATAFALFFEGWIGARQFAPNPGMERGRARYLFDYSLLTTFAVGVVLALARPDSLKRLSEGSLALSVASVAAGFLVVVLGLSFVRLAISSVLLRTRGRLVG